MKYNKEYLRNLSKNGYSFAYYSEGLYYFQKQVKGGYNLVKANESDIVNDNISFMLINELSR